MIRPVSQTTYVPHIDGLRALAVLSVIVYHLHASWLPGGFSGVDIFFVISGFVVSASLAEFRMTTLRGFFAFFYARRILRIVPALVVCLVVTHVATMLFIPYAWLSGSNERAGLYAFFGLSNFILAGVGNDYFSPRAEFNPYTHTWSLGVEEQFYLIFPPLFAAWLAGGRRRLMSSILFAIGLVGSMVWAAWLSRSDRDLAFYMLYTRFWELAAGVLLYQALVSTGHAFSEAHRPATWISQGGALVSAALVCAGFVLARPAQFPYPGALLSVAGTVGLLGFLHGREPRGVIMRLLRLRAVVFVGQISYSLYLWHWPVFVLFRWTCGLQSGMARAAALLVAFGLAVGSYYVIERPPRRSARVRALPRVAVILGGALLIASSAMLANAVSSRVEAWSLTRVGRDMPDWYPGRLDRIGKRNCRLAARGENVGGGTLSIWSGIDCERPPASKPRLFVIGDSHTEAYSTMLILFAMDSGGEVYKYNNGGCPFLSLQLNREGGACPANTDAALRDMLGRIGNGDILFMPSLRLNRLSNQDNSLDEAAAWQGMIGAPAAAMRQRAVDQAVAVLQPFAARGVRLVFEAPKPILRVPPFRCMDWFNKDNPDCAAGLTMPRAELERYRQPVVQALAEIARRVPGVRVWDPFPLFCPGDTCSATMNGMPLYYDGDHPSGYANRMLAPHFERWIGQLIGDTAIADAPGAPVIAGAAAASAPAPPADRSSRSPDPR